MVEDAIHSNPSTGTKRPFHRCRQIYLQIFVGMMILICGIVIGWGTTVLHMKDKMMIPPGRRPPTREVVEDMEVRYDLTPEQARQVEAAFGKRRESLQTLFDEFRTKSEAEFQKLSADIKKILTTEQYERWERDFQRRRRPEPWERGPGRPGGRGPGPRGPDERRHDKDFDGRDPGRDFNGRGSGPLRPGPKESVEEIPGPNGPGLDEPKSKNGE